MLEYRNNIDDELNLKNINKCMELINKNKILFIEKGQQGEIFKVKSDDCGSVIIKKKLIREQDIKWKNNEQWMKDELEVEYKIMLLTNRIVDNNICPNFIKTYGFNKNVPLIIMEYADGDSNFLFKDVYYDTHIYKSFICQTLIAIYVFNNYTMLYHRDMKSANVLYKKIDVNTIFHYKINGNDYYVPTYGYLFMICDFGVAKFKLDGRKIDIVNFNNSIIKTYADNFNKKYYDHMNKSDVNIMQTIKSSDEILNGKMNKDINSLTSELLKNKNIQINKYVFEIYSVLNSDNNIIDLLNSKYSDFTSKKEEYLHIVSFNFHS